MAADKTTSCISTSYAEFRQRLARSSGNAAVRDFTEQAVRHPLWIKAA